MIRLSLPVRLPGRHRRKRSLALAATVAGLTLSLPGFTQAPAPKSAPLITPSLVPSNNAPYAGNPGYIRAGAPILFSGRVFPPDASGTLAFAVDGAPVATVPLVPAQALGDYIALGDSITYSGYIADPAQRYQSIVGQALHLSVTGYGAPGYTACQVMPTEVIPNNVGVAPGTSPLLSLMIGTNDINLFGTGAHESLFNLCHQATLSWLAVPLANKILPGGAGLSIRSGPWTATALGNGCCIDALVIANTAGTLRFTLPVSGTAAYLWYEMGTAAPGSFTVSIDGAAPSNPVSTQYASAPGEAEATYGVLRLAVPPGTHTFDVSVIDGTVGILGLGAAPTPGASGLPTVLATDIPNQQNGAAAAIAAYTADIANNVSTLRADGLDIRFVPTQASMLATPAEMMDDRHPSSLGLAHLAAALLAAITPAAPASDTVLASGAALTLSNLAVGAHNVSLVYSGDNRYTAQSATTGVVIYDGASSTALFSTSTVFPVQSPIVLTATVPQGNANGLVTILEQTSSGNITLGSSWMNANLPGTASLTLPSLPAGPHTLIAQYLGDAHYYGSASQPLNLTVSGSYTATTLSAPATRFNGGADVNLTASVAPAFVSGSVTFLDGTKVLGQVPLTNGLATFTASGLSTGIHAFTATFSGTATQDSSSSPVLSIEIDPNPTTVTLAPLPAAIPYNQPLTLSASVSPSIASGIVVFKDLFTPAGQLPNGNGNPKILGPSTLSASSATFVPPAPAIGNHIFTAVYAGDSLDLPSVSLPVALEITLIASAISLAPVPASFPFGTTLNLAAYVTPADSTGIVTFSDTASGVLAQVPLSNGSALASLSSFASGPHAFTAAYSGDSLHAPSASPALSTAVTPASTSTTLSPLPPTVVIGNALTLSAAVLPASATGTVTFRDATVGTLGQATVSNGSASFSLSSPPIAAYLIAATYSGDFNHAPSTSGAQSTLVILRPTSITLASSAPSALIAAPVVLSATVGNAAAAGTITFWDGARNLGSVLLAGGHASLSTSALAIGTHALEATYSGDPLDASSTSPPLTEIISAVPTGTALTVAQNIVIAGTAAVFNIRVSSSNTVPTGIVSVRSGSVVLASGPLGNAAAGAAYATLTIDSASLGLGTFPLIASYSGDAVDAPSDSGAAPLSLVVAPIPTSEVLALSTAQIPAGGVVTVSAGVRSPGNMTTTGSVTFLLNGAPFGSAPLGPSGLASIPLSGLQIGKYLLTATFVPVGLYAAASAPAQMLAVTAPFAVALTPSALTLAPGATANTSLILAPLSGFTGSATASCASPIAFVVCRIDPVPAFNGAAAVSAAVHITIATTFGADAPRTLPGSRSLPIFFALLLPLLRLRKLKVTRRKGLTLVGLSLAAVLGAVCVNGCAEGGNFGTVPPGPQSVTVTAITPYTSIPITLTVNVTQ